MMAKVLDFLSSGFSAMCSFWKDFWEDPYYRFDFRYLVTLLLSAYFSTRLSVYLGNYSLLFWALPPFLLLSDAFHERKVWWPPVLKMFKPSGAMFKPSPRKLFWQTFLLRKYAYALVPLVLFTMLVNRVERFGWFQHLEVAIQDILTRIRSHTISTPILIVEVTENDYKDFFLERSPLASHGVLTLIKAIQQGYPRVIGVDLDTRSEEEWARLNKEDAQELKADLNETNIIWAEVPDEITRPDPRQEPGLKLAPVLGSWSQTSKLQTSHQMGIVRFPQDVDGVVRRSFGKYEVAANPPHSIPTRACIDSFYRAIARRWRPPGPNDESEEAYIRFSADHDSLQILQANQFLQKKGDKVELKLSEDEQRSLRRMLCEKIVLIGGDYSAARDEYMTPLGRMAGVELIANAIDSDLKRSIRAVKSCVVRTVVDLVMGSLIVLVYFIWKDSPGIALVVSLLTILIPLLVGAFTFFILDMWLSAAPVMVGTMIHEMCESTHTSQELAKGD